MATYSKFQPFVLALAHKLHNLGSDQLTVALSNTAPSAAYSQLSQISQISYTNLSSRNLTTSSSVQSSGVYKLTVGDIVLSASGGNVGPFRYIVVYNNTATNDELICYFDIGSSVTLLDGGQPLTLDFDQTNGLFTIQ
jgi:hypothetical protein